MGFGVLGVLSGDGLTASGCVGLGGRTIRWRGIFSRGTSQVLCLDKCVFFCASQEVGPTRFAKEREEKQAEA